MKTSKLLLVMLFIFLLSYLFAIPVFGFSTYPSITFISKTFDKIQSFRTESVTIIVIFEINEPFDLRGFYYVDHIPQGLTVNTASVKIDGNEISNYVEEFDLVGDVYDGAFPYRLILETPNTFEENNPIVPGSTLEIVYSISSAQLGMFDFDEFFWVGYYQQAAEGERTAFGYSEDIDKQTITFVNSSPQANDDTSATSDNTSITIDVLANDNDPDGTINPDTLTIGLIPSNGSVIVNDNGTATYTPFDNFTGTDMFTYTVKDNEGDTSNEAEVIITVNDSSNTIGEELAVDFKTAGIYIYDNEYWKGIYHGGIDPVSMVGLYDKLAIDFGPEYGVYLYDGVSWTKIHYGLEVEKMAGFNGKLAVDFGISFGIYEYNPENPQWLKIYGKNKPFRDSMIGFGDKLVFDFKTLGIYIYDNGIWNKIYHGGIDPVNITSFDNKLAIDFGLAYGLYVYEYESNTWKRIYKGVAIEKMTGFDNYLAVDFGILYGLYVFNYDTNTWTRIYKGAAINRLTGFNNKLAIDFGTIYGIYEYTFETNMWKKIYHANMPRDDNCTCDVLE